MELKINEKVVGQVREDEYHTDRKPEHFFVKYRGFGISDEVLYELIALGIKNICLTYHSKASLLQYRSSVRDFLNIGIPFTDPSNPGDSQHILPVACMSKEGEG